MIGAIEFLQKKNAICIDRKNQDMNCMDVETGNTCPAYQLCHGTIGYSEADLVRKVMDYELATDEFDGKAKYEEAFKEIFDICDICECDQVIDCVYIDNDDRESCPKYRGEEPDD